MMICHRTMFSVLVCALYFVFCNQEMAEFLEIKEEGSHHGAIGVFVIQY